MVISSGNGVLDLPSLMFAKEAEKGLNDVVNNEGNVNMYNIFFALVALFCFVGAASAETPRERYNSDKALGAAEVDIYRLNRDQLQAVIEYLASCKPTPAPERDYRCERAAEIVDMKTPKSYAFQLIRSSIFLEDAIINWTGSVNSQVFKTISRRQVIFDRLKVAVAKRYLELSSKSTNEDYLTSAVAIVHQGTKKKFVRLEALKGAFLFWLKINGEAPSTRRFRELALFLATDRKEADKFTNLDGDRKEMNKEFPDNGLYRDKIQDSSLIGRFIKEDIPATPRETKKHPAKPPSQLKISNGFDLRKSKSRNRDGSFSTERTIGAEPAKPPSQLKISNGLDLRKSKLRNRVGAEIDGKFYLLPTIIDGKEVSAEEALRLFESGKSTALGVFNSKEEAIKAATNAKYSKEKSILRKKR